LPTCNGNSATICNSDGSGYTGGETDCGDQICFSGVCEDGYLAEDFEDGDYDGWTSPGGSYTRTVTGSQAADGTTYSLQLTGGNSDHRDGLAYLFDGIQPSYVSYWAQATSTGTYGTYFVLSETQGDFADDEIVFIYFNMGTISAWGASSTSLGSYIAGQWYPIELALDWSAKTIDFTVNDVVVQTGVSFRETCVVGVGMLSLYNLSSTTGYWDEIIVR
jgi:hypothetical protein